MIHLAIGVSLSIQQVSFNDVGTLMDADDAYPEDYDRASTSSLESAQLVLFIRPYPIKYYHRLI